MTEHAVVTRSRTTILFVGAAAAAWALTVERMRGMDGGPGMGLGNLEWYLGLWVAMSAAMMLPTAAHAAELARVVRAVPAILFAAGYLAVWTVFGIAAYALIRNELDTKLVAAVVVAAGIYELTPLKRRSLRRCRSHHGATTALRSGLRHGVDCMGSSGGLMVVLLVLGLMSLLWMAVIAAAIFAQKVLPQGPRLSPFAAAGLVALGISLALSPATIPW